jgi:octaprenyl-diphosphate synthase
LPEVLAAIHATGGLEYSRQRASNTRAARARLDGFADNDYTAACAGWRATRSDRDH